jgi:hypothetical protein
MMHPGPAVVSSLTANAARLVVPKKKKKSCVCARSGLDLLRTE